MSLAVVTTNYWLNNEKESCVSCSYGFVNRLTINRVASGCGHRACCGCVSTSRPLHHTYVCGPGSTTGPTRTPGVPAIDIIIIIISTTTTPVGLFIQGMDALLQRPTACHLLIGGLEDDIDDPDGVC